MTKRFPRTESDITTLAGRVIDGLTNAAEDFAAPPVSPRGAQGEAGLVQGGRHGDRGRRDRVTKSTRGEGRCLG